MHNVCNIYEHFVYSSGMDFMIHVWDIETKKRVVSATYHNTKRHRWVPQPQRRPRNFTVQPFTYELDLEPNPEPDPDANLRPNAYRRGC